MSTKLILQNVGKIHTIIITMIIHPRTPITGDKGPEME
jgi:hypothetical protein